MNLIDTAFCDRSCDGFAGYLFNLACILGAALEGAWRGQLFVVGLAVQIG